MITPEEIRQKAEKAYPRILSAWAAGDIDSLFPMRLPANLSLVAGDLPATIAAVDQLRANRKRNAARAIRSNGSKRVRATSGTTSSPTKSRSRRSTISCRSADKQKHFAASCRAAKQSARAIARAGRLDRRAHSRNCRNRGTARWPDSGRAIFSRQSVARLLHPPNPGRRWTPNLSSGIKRCFASGSTHCFPSSAIQPGETKFALRFGLRDGQPHTTIRTLDPNCRPSSACRSTSFPCRYGIWRRFPCAMRRPSSSRIA